MPANQFWMGIGRSRSKQKFYSLVYPEVVMVMWEWSKAPD